MSGLKNAGMAFGALVIGLALHPEAEPAMADIRRGIAALRGGTAP